MIVLDTHVLVWWISNPERLSPKALKIVDKAKKKKELYVSSITVWEICMLVKRKRLKLTIDVHNWLSEVESLPAVNFVPVDNKIAKLSVFLKEPFLKDPADRLIIATALSLGASLVTSDKNILSYRYVKSVW